jgi:SAM-dependent methyltransferase
VPEPPVLTGVARLRQLWTLFRREQVDPVPFYTVLAREAVADLESRYGCLAGKVVVDLGCGPGHYTRALRAAGAVTIPVDNSEEESRLEGGPPEGLLVADAGALPLEDGSVDGVFASNLLEHTPDAHAVIREMERVLRPGGWGLISWTNWYSPWGGHDMSPYHYLGPRLGPRLYERLHGPPRKNPLGAGLWPVHVGPTIRFLRARPGLLIESIEPRYWPRLRFVTRVPVLRELVTWNCMIRVRRR